MDKLKKEAWEKTAEFLQFEKGTIGYMRLKTLYDKAYEAGCKNTDKKYEEFSERMNKLLNEDNDRLEEALQKRNEELIT